MRPFNLVEPANVDEACAALARFDEAKPIAGGTALVILMKQGLFVPEVLVNLSKIQDFADIALTSEGFLRIGAMATIQQVESHALVRDRYPALSAACHVVANVRIRNVATIGGNLAHADYQSDPPTVLLALDALVELRSVQGSRQVPLDGFLRGPYVTSLEPAELVSAVLIPAPPKNHTSTYLKFTTGSSEERPCVGVAAMIRSDDGTCGEARLAVGAATSRPVRVRSAEEMALGQPLTDELFEMMASTAAGAIDPVEDLNGDAQYKRRVVRALTRRAVQACIQSGDT